MSILDAGFNLMLYGMGTVFVFLSILIVTTMLMSKFIARFLPQEEPQTATTTPPISLSRPSQIDPQVLRVIQVALTEHRNKK